MNEVTDIMIEDEMYPCAANIRLVELYLRLEANN